VLETPHENTLLIPSQLHVQYQFSGSWKLATVRVSTAQTLSTATDPGWWLNIYQFTMKYELRVVPMPGPNDHPLSHPPSSSPNSHHDQ
jgi:hypothetical protein